MSITVLATKRAHGRLYAQVHLSDEAADCTLRVSAATGDGSVVPVRALVGDDEGEWLVMLPSLATTAIVKLQAVTWDGEVAEETEQRFNPLTSRIAPPVISLRRGSRGLSPMRIPDVHRMLEEWDVMVLRLVSTPEGQEICQGYAELVSAGRQGVEGTVNIRVMDARGRDVSRGPWICLDDTVTRLADHPGFFMRHVEFSVRIPTSTNALVVCVDPATPTDAGEEGEQPTLPSGFGCLSPRVMSGLREAWKVLATPAEDDESYDLWFSNTHAATEADLAMQQADSFDRTVSFSVVCVAREASAEALRATVDSVLVQSYGHLELVLVNAAPNNPRLASVVRGLELSDARVKSVPLGADFGPAAATSEGIDAATGDFVCLLGEGDLLAPDALWCLARAIANNPDADLLYTDEDRVVRGRHCSPSFKPDWDRDLLLGTNYLGGLMAVRSILLADLDTMGSDLDGAQNHYLALYASARARRVYHVARVLYHKQGESDAARGTTVLASELVALRRYLAEVEPDAIPRASTRVAQCLEINFAMPGADGELEPIDLDLDEEALVEDSTVASGEQVEQEQDDSVAEDASEEEVQEVQEAAEAEDSEAQEALADEAKAEADVPAADSVPAKGLAEPVAQPPLVSIIIASRDRSDSLDRCLRSIREHTAYKNYEVIIVENGSEDPRTFEYYRSAEAADPRVKTIFYQQDGTFDEARLVNFGASRASGDYILLMHNDVEVTDGEWMSRLVSLCARKGTGAAAARLVRVDGTIESSGMHLTSSGPVADGRYLLSRANERPQTALLHSVTMASGACLMVDAAAFFQLGGMQLRYPARLGDADLCLRLWGLGLRVVIDPKVELLHHRSLVAEDCGSGTTSDIRAIGRLWESWPFGQSPCDPTMGPNLDQQSGYRALLA